MGRSYNCLQEETYRFTAYRLNHEEIIEGFKEGIRFAEKLSPVEAVRNKYGAVDEMKFEIQETFASWKSKKEKLVNSGKYITFKSKVSNGSSRNFSECCLWKEHPGTFRLMKQIFFKPYTVSFNDKREPYIVPSEDSKDAFSHLIRLMINHFILRWQIILFMPVML